MRIALHVGALLGLTLLVFLGVRVDIGAILHVLHLAGWRLLWLVPYRALFFLLYALGWATLLRAYDREGRAGLGYLFWVTTVRDAIDRLLPVASVGGSVAAVRLLSWRGFPVAQSAASVIAEILLTLFAVYLFSVLGALLLLEQGLSLVQHRVLLLALLLSLPIPVATLLILRYGAMFRRVQSVLRVWVGAGRLSEGAASIDHEVRASLQRTRSLLIACGLQFVALLSGAFEVWFVLRLFGHPVGSAAALMLESMTQAIRHVAFVVPAGLGVQEAGLILFGRTLGVDAELAVAVSMTKRLREVLWGVASLLSWQWMEARN